MAGPRRLLLVDDDPPTRELLREMGESAGFLVDVAEGGEAALLGELAGGSLACVVFGALDSHSSPCPCSICKVVLAYGRYARGVSITSAEMSHEEAR